MQEPAILKLMSNVFGVPVSALSASSNRESVNGWDSLAHIHFVVALEAEANVSFTPDEAIALDSVDAVVRALRAKGR